MWWWSTHKIWNRHKALRFRSTYGSIHDIFTVYCVWLHALLSFSSLLLRGILLFIVFLHTKKKEPSPRESSFSDAGSHHACILLCYSKACTMNVTMSNSHGSWQKDPVLPFVSLLSSSALTLQLWMSVSIRVFSKQRLPVCITHLFPHLFHCFQQSRSLLLKSENGLLQFAFIGQ